VARETRRQRRDARREAGEQAGNIGRPPRLRTAEAGGPGPDGGSGGSSFEATLAPPRRRFSFLREVIGELHKVEWPNRAQVVQGTVVVIVACAIVGTFLWAADLVLKPFVQHVLLGQ
jgi:preprotein translocase SecE subunit